MYSKKDMKYYYCACCQDIVTYENVEENDNKHNYCGRCWYHVKGNRKNGQNKNHKIKE